MNLSNKPMCKEGQELEKLDIKTDGLASMISVKGSAVERRAREWKPAACGRRWWVQLWRKTEREEMRGGSQRLKRGTHRVERMRTQQYVSHLRSFLSSFDILVFFFFFFLSPFYCLSLSSPSSPSFPPFSRRTINSIEQKDTSKIWIFSPQFFRKILLKVDQFKIFF